MFKKLIYLCLVTLVMYTNVYAKRPTKGAAIDHMSLATMMIYDGNYEKAKLELEQVDTNKKNFDFAKYYSMQGIVAMKMEQYPSAIGHFEKAVEKTKTKTYEIPEGEKEKFTLYKYFFKKEENKSKKPTFDIEKVRAEQIGKLYLYMSEAYYKLKQYDKTVEMLDLAGEQGSNKAKLFTLRADCFWKLKEHTKAFDALNRGLELFANDKTLLKQKFYYYVDLGLFQKALEVSDAYLASTEPNAKDYITIAQALSSANQYDKAIVLLEKAKLIFPKEPQVGILLGHLYLKKDMRHTTADLFEKSSYYDEKYTHEAAEMHRRVNAIPHALYLNTQIRDEAEKIKQKVAIYVEREEFAKVIGLKDAMYRYNVLKDENLRYALAYAYFMAKDYTKAEFHLKKLTSSELFSKATMIRKTIEKCKNDSMECI